MPVWTADQKPRIPHTRGDEPKCSTEKPITEYVFPTHVGMNRRHHKGSKRARRIPHTRGDEPADNMEIVRKQSYSPHTWG